MRSKRNVRIIGIATTVMAIVAVLAAFCMPAMADCCKCEVETNGTCSTGEKCSYGTNGTLANGTIYVDGKCKLCGTGEIEKVDFGTLPGAGKVKWARVYWHTWGGSPWKTGWSNVTFCDESSCDDLNRSITDTCLQNDSMGWYKGGCGTHWLYWNVTDKVTTGEQHNITIDNLNGVWDGRVGCVYLVVALDDLDDYTGTGITSHYWINQGYEDSDSGVKNTTWFNGAATTDRKSTLWHLGLCSEITSGGIWFNVHNVRPDVPYELTEEEIDGSWVDPTNNNMTWDNGNDDWFHPVMAIFMDCRPPGKDLVVEDIEIPEMMRPNKNYKINATVKNRGSSNVTANFNVSLYLDGSSTASDTQNITKLNVSESKAVNFTATVSFSSPGCHEFKVVADVDDDVTEIGEGNNEETENSQVGYVIVVKSDSDFADLVNDTGLPTNSVKKVGGTYYIQNMTIENCAGDGISIENTKTAFVVNNCTILNCTGGSGSSGSSGVYLNNLTSGTVNGSVIKNNTYGLRVGDMSLQAVAPDLVNITNSTIEFNSIDGIDLVGSNCTVCNNKGIQNNTDYGVFVLGDDNNITDNNISYNGEYGVKLFDSSGCYVYDNTFVDNNINYPDRTSQGWDNRTTNHWNNSGNYWSDYSGYDGDNNGIGEDIPYDIDGGTAKDYYPVCTPELCSVDLEINKVWVNWTEEGCDCNIKYNITCIGNGTVPAGHNTTMFLEGSEEALDNVGVNIKSGVTYTRCFSGYTWTYTPPKDNISVCADYNNTVENETDEGNWYKDWLSSSTNPTWECGDVNHVNADPDINDARAVYKYWQFTKPLIDEWAADVDHDRDIDINDARAVYKYWQFSTPPLDCFCD